MTCALGAALREHQRTSAPLGGVTEPAVSDTAARDYPRCSRAPRRRAFGAPESGRQTRQAGRGLLRRLGTPSADPRSALALARPTSGPSRPIRRLSHTTPAWTRRRRRTDTASGRRRCAQLSRRHPDRLRRHRPGAGRWWGWPLPRRRSAGGEVVERRRWTDERRLDTVGEMLVVAAADRCEQVDQGGDGLGWGPGSCRSDQASKVQHPAATDTGRESCPRRPGTPTTE